MKALYLAVIFSVIAMAVPISQAEARHSSYYYSTVGVDRYPSQMRYGSTTFYVYPDHRMMARYYNQRVILDMIGLAKQLGWSRVYLASNGYPGAIPNHLHSYARHHFYRNHIYLGYYRPHYYNYYQYQFPRYRHYHNPSSGFSIRFNF